MNQRETKAILTSLYENGPSNDTENEDSMCDVDEEAILGYAEAQLAGAPVSEQMAHIRDHLLSCGTCRSICEESQMLFGLGDDPALPDTIQMPEFDLAFLPSTLEEHLTPESHQPRRSWTLDHLSRLVIEFSEQLLSTLQPTPQIAFAKSQPNKNDSLFEFTVDEHDDLLVKIVGKKSRSSADLCDLAISVDVPSRGGWPMLAGIKVDVRRRDLLLACGDTDAFGRVLVKGIKRKDLPRLTFAVDPTVQEGDRQIFR